jgi:hypothetical protein
MEPGTIFFIGLALVITGAQGLKALQRRRLRAVILRRLGLESVKAANAWRGIGGK